MTILKTSDYVFYDGEPLEGSSEYLDRQFVDVDARARFVSTVKKYRLRVK